MTPEEIEKKKIIQEWLDKAGADLESAEVLIKETDNYDIVAYHSHQAVEKYFKALLLENNIAFKYVHDLNALFLDVVGFLPTKPLEEEISFLNSLYPRLRYPTGELVAREDAEKCLKIAKKIVNINIK